MSLVAPNLDDRDFEALCAEAHAWIKKSCPTWSDLGPSDPGITLVEVFAHLTETLIYRLNRLPEKAFVEFLRLLSVQRRAPSAAKVELLFTRTPTADEPVALEIPRGTRVAGQGPEGPVEFTTEERLVLAADQAAGRVWARHGRRHEGELVGVGTGQGMQSFRVGRAPIHAELPGASDLLVGVEALEPVDESRRAVRHDGRTFVLWDEVPDFANLDVRSTAFVADRASGTIQFAPLVRDALGQAPAVPGPMREVRAWYRSGAGTAGNVPAGTLTELVDGLEGVSVTQPEAATGGSALESLDAALVRGPLELRGRDRAVTASDYELLACAASGAVARAKAHAPAASSACAIPGTVELLILAQLGGAAPLDGPVTRAMLRAQETEGTRLDVQRALESRTPLGARLEVRWVRFKEVRVVARVVVHNQERAGAVRQRILERLYQNIQPYADPSDGSLWAFGQALHASDVYRTILAEPGVAWVDHVELHVDESPSSRVDVVVAEAFDAHTWHVADGAQLFVSLDDGDDWQLVHDFGHPIERVVPHPERAGTWVVTTREEATRVFEDADEATPHRVAVARSIWISRDDGRTFELLARLEFAVRDLCWHLRGNEEYLLLATQRGLFELGLESTSAPVPLEVDPARRELGFWAVVSVPDVAGKALVALAAQDQAGVFVSTAAAASGSFVRAGLEGDDVRVLAVQRAGGLDHLWAGTTTVGLRRGSGCRRALLGPDGISAADWQTLDVGWLGGGCHALAFARGYALAATHTGGVLTLKLGSLDAGWQACEVSCGLPVLDVGRFQPVRGLAASAETGHVLAGSVGGVFRSPAGDAPFEACSSGRSELSVGLPPTWLIHSGVHEVEVIRSHEARKD